MKTTLLVSTDSSAAVFRTIQSVEEHLRISFDRRLIADGSRDKAFQKQLESWFHGYSFLYDADRTLEPGFLGQSDFVFWIDSRFVITKRFTALGPLSVMSSNPEIVQMGFPTPNTVNSDSVEHSSPYGLWTEHSAGWSADCPFICPSWIINEHLFEYGFPFAVPWSRLQKSGYAREWGAFGFWGKEPLAELQYAL